MQIGENKIPNLHWEDFIPPPFLQPWKKFLILLQGQKCGSKGFDDTIAQLIPMFNGSHIRLPFRILSEREVLQLSGLEDLWTNTSFEGAERLPERVIRDYCGNSFHPSLIYSALGNDLQLRRWVNGEAEGIETPVADKNAVLKIYTQLCEEVAKLGKQHGFKLEPQIVKEFPPYPDPISTHDCTAAPRVFDAVLVGPRPPTQSKKERFTFNCSQAAIHQLGAPISKLLRDFGLEVCFDAFRAPVR